MKATGMVRNIDDLGRLVLPVELRDTMGISKRDSLEIFVDGSAIILRKYEPGCIFCGEEAADGMITYWGRNVCAACAEELGDGAGEPLRPKGTVKKEKA